MEHIEHVTGLIVMTDAAAVASCADEHDLVVVIVGDKSHCI